MSVSDHSAADSALGYYFQGLFALVLLFDASDDSNVSIETDDDVVLEGSGEPRLVQLKHSTGTPPPISIKNDGLWKTLGIWIAIPNRGSCRFTFVTCARLAEGSSLAALTRADSDRSAVVAELVAEAVHVTAKRRKPRKSGTKAPYPVRGPACDAFLSLNDEERLELVNRISLWPESFNAATATQELKRRLPVVLPEQRDVLVERLIEWWDRQVALALLGKRPRLIYKRDLQRRMLDLIAEQSGERLACDFARQQPPSVAAELGGVMERQIRLVEGGDDRLTRAAVARWRARNQRNAWLERDPSLARVLIEFDETLVERWHELHGPLRHDYRASPLEEKRTAGCKLLDWSHQEAPRQIEPPRPTWSAPFLVQGSYQQLADERTVGWHPDYIELLRRDDENVT